MLLAMSISARGAEGKEDGTEYGMRGTLVLAALLCSGCETPVLCFIQSGMCWLRASADASALDDGYLEATRFSVMLFGNFRFLETASFESSSSKTSIKSSNFAGFDEYDATDGC